ncbi:MAG: cell division/cell wall cluster transcriptional repressor MraZ [Candidatus Dormibacteria bacterium]|jgi:MraZ protein
MAFSGRYEHSLDERGRVAIPARFREELRGGWVTTHPAGFLLMYPQRDWEALTAEFRYDLIAEAGYSGFVRRLYADSQEITWDSQGRILLQPRLRQHAGLESNVVFVGVNNVVEVHSDQSISVQAGPLNSDEWESMRLTVAGQHQPRSLAQGPEAGPR